MVNDDCEKEVQFVEEESEKEEKKAPINTMEAIKNTALQQIGKIADDCNTGEKTMSQGAMEALSVATTVDVAQDPRFRKELQKKKRKEIGSSFEADTLTSKAEKSQAKQLNREAFYTAFRPILELDFSNITGIEPKRKIVREGKTFSYTIPIMLLVLPFASFLFLIGTALLMVIKLGEAICDYIVKLGDKAVKISFWLFIIAIILLASYIIIGWVETTFGLSII